VTVDVESIPLVDLSIQHRAIAAEIEPQLARVMETGAFIDGADVGAFEEEFAAYCGVEHCISVANGTDAIELALRAGNIGAGDAVVLPANTFVATAEAVVRIGAVPVLIDVDPRSLLMDPARLATVIDDTDARAVVAVHLYGQMAPMHEIARVARSRGCLLVEDAAQSQGALQDGDAMGAWGDLAATSFYPGKNLGAYGDGGAVLCRSADLARTVRLLRSHGSEVRYRHEIVGWNSRLDTMQAVVLRAKLRRLDGWNTERRAAADRYAELLCDADDVVVPTTERSNTHVWHLYVVRVPQRDRVLAQLQAEGIGVGVHYPVPVHLQPAFAGLGKGVGAFPVTERASEAILSLPIFPGISPAQQERVVERLLAALPRR
jgi:dTDP-4-amino-4,6-dideoxygalactose transaminase